MTTIANPIRITKMRSTDKLTVTIKITKELKLRLAMAKYLIVIAAKILGCQINIQECRE